MLKLKSTVMMLLAFGVSAANPAADTSTGQWPYYGGTIGFNRYSPLDDINPANVSGLKVIRTRPAIDASITSRFQDLVADPYFRPTPIMIDGVLYAPDGVGLVEAFDAQTGRTLWVQEPQKWTMKELVGSSTRGVAYWGGGPKPRILSIRKDYLYALDAGTGKPCADFGTGGRVSLRRASDVGFIISEGPMVVGNIVIVGGGGGGEQGNDSGYQMKSIPESVRAFDVITGRQLWSFSPMPAVGDAARSSWGGKSAELAGAMGSYGSFTADERLGLVYVPFSAPNPPSWGGWRAGNNEYSNSLLALDVKTGRKVWSYQLIHHDLWDYDLSAPPILGDITVDGKRIHAVMQTGKNALLFTLDRETGKPVWPIVETPVPQSTVPGEHTSRTQPIPSKPPALDRQGFTTDELIDFTPELRRQALEIVKAYDYGAAYTPPTIFGKPAGHIGTLTLPGTDGGGNWNSGSFDPETQTYYTVMVSVPAGYALEPPKQADATVKWVMRQDGPGIWNVDGPQGLPLLKPPYGRLEAVDMSKGEFRWVVPNGDGPRNHPLLKHLNLPPLGIPGRAALVVTKNLIFVGESSDAVFMAEPTGGYGNKFRAYDKTNGKVLAELTLPAGTTSAPMTYKAGGQQYVLVAIGGRTHDPEWVILGL